MCSPAAPRAIALLALLLGVVIGRPGAHAQEQRPIVVSENGRHLAYEDGEAFFYLGDTAWELFHRLDRQEATLYLQDRADKGFTVIQAVVLAQLGGLSDPNPYGAVPLEDRDPEQPNEAYFTHVDYVVAKADSLGLVVGMLPTWGSYWKNPGGSDRAIFTPANARVFGRFLGSRYRDAPVIWILGGDDNVETPDERAIIDAMAAGLAEGDGGRHLVTFHPRGPGLSSQQVHGAEWLDFNMIQSSHGGRGHDTGLFVEHDYHLTPVKPTLDGEPRYEAIPVGFYFRNADFVDRFDAFDVRQAAYWALLAGAAGHTYGNNNVWQMWSPEHEPVLGADTPWWRALDHPGAFQMRHVRRLFTSRPFEKLAPEHELVVDGPDSGDAAIRAARADDGSYAFVYSPMGRPFTVDKQRIAARRIRAIWYNPRYGTAHHVHTSDNFGFQTYTPPSSGRGQDWVLILEDDSAGFPLPGE